MSNVDRREFLKLVGAGSVGVGAGYMLAESIKHPVEHLIPYAVPPEEFSPGVATHYNSVCRMCPAGCGITVRTREGRAKKIEGNPLHPVNQGHLCALGQAGLQVLYNPDRLTAPMIQAGERGSDKFIRTTWTDGLSRVAQRLAQARDNGENIVVLSEGVRGHLADLFELFIGQFGSGELLHYDFAHPHSLRAANRQLFGIDQLPYYDIRHSSFMLSFGADYLNNWLSPVHHGLGFGDSRQGDGDGRGYFVQIEQKMSISGAAADEWVPANPGTEGILALGIARKLVAAGVYTGEDAADWSNALAIYTPDYVADKTGVPAGTVNHLADEFSAAEHALAIGGGAAGNHTNGVDTLISVNVLNYLVGNIGKPGGIVFNPQPAIGGSVNKRQANHQSMQALIESATAGRIDLLLISNTNPAYTLPKSDGFKEALAAIGMVVSLSSFIDETTAMADIILPSHTYLESWGDDTPEPGVGFSVGSIAQPVVSPLYNTRATGDILLGLASEVGLEEAMPWISLEEYLKDGWRQIHGQSAHATQDFDSFWRDVLRSGVWGENRRGEDPVVVDKKVIESLSLAEPEFAGSQDDYPFVLQPYLSTALYDGRGANLPWMQELPDPATSIVYGSWVEMNPVTADKMGLADGDLVQVTSEHGSIEAPLVVFPAIMPGVVAAPIGQGHDALGRYARNRGINPLQLLAPKIDLVSGSLATGATRVSLVATGKRARPVRTGGESRQLGRDIVQSTGGRSAHSGHSTKLDSIPITVEPA